jgi:hypothetical protein
MRNLLEEFENGKNKPTILGVREHYFTERYAHLSKVLFTLFSCIMFMSC